MSSEPSNRGLGIARGVVKIIAIAVGLIGTLSALMASVGALTANIWVRFGVALVVSVVVPAVLVDRLLPDGESPKARGLVGDVFAVIWLGFTALFVVGLSKLTSPLLVREGDRLTQAGLGAPAGVAYFLGGAAVTRLETPAPSSSAGAAASASAPAGPPPDAPSPSASSPAAAPQADAGAPPDKPPKKPAAPNELTPAELFKKLAPSVVTVSVKVGELEGGGTGFLVDREGTIVTNHHVVGEAQKLLIRFMSGATYEEIDLLAEDAAQDLALLRVDIKKPKTGDAPKLDPLGLGNSDEVQVGERVISIGNPLGLEHTLSDGLVSQRRTYMGRQWIQTTAPISPGNSGGPLFDMKGSVIGITTAQVGAFRAQNLNLAVPVNHLKSLLRSSYPQRRRIGSGQKSSTW